MTDYVMSSNKFFRDLRLMPWFPITGSFTSFLERLLFVVCTSS